MGMEKPIDMQFNPGKTTETVDLETAKSLILRSDHNLFFRRISSALFYAVSSFCIVVINKIVLTNFKFPSVHALGIGQMMVTFFVLQCGKVLNVISFPPISDDIPKKIFPLPLFYLGNLVCGLGGTKHLSLPMFTVLRRFTILLTLILEFIVLRVHQRPVIVCTVLAMVGGAVIAAMDDLSFDPSGYSFVLFNDFFTAGNNVYVKKKLDARDLGKFGLLFYNALFMFFPLFLISWYTGDITQAISFEGWKNAAFLISFVLSCVMGFILMYSTVLCTAYNSALTTTIVGVLKNILITYIGMHIGGDYVFSWMNFIGLNVSMAGSLMYSYLTFTKSGSTKLAVRSVQANVEENEQSLLILKDVSKNLHY